jgi:GNAT superfamily N-acetyltransferase
VNQSNSINVRDARAEDVETLVGYACAMAWETERKRLTADVVRHGIETVLDSPARGRYFVVEQAGKTIATMMLTYEWSDWRCADWWWIQSVYVAEDSRRVGAFRALYAHALALAETTPAVCGIRLYVERDNQHAQQTYESLGMQDAGYRMFEHSLPWLKDVIR